MDARELYDEAWTAQQGGDYARALEAVESALRLDPDVENGHNLAGWLLLYHSPEVPERVERAIGHFVRAHARRPGLRAPFVNLCDALAMAGRGAEAVALCREASAVDPAATEYASEIDAGAHFWRGWQKAYPEQDAVAALPLFARAAARSPRWGPARQQHALTLEVTGALDASYREHAESLFCDDLPDRALAHARLAWHQQSRGLASAALSSFRRALFHERRTEGARAPEIERAAQALEALLRAKPVYFPDQADELEWIAIEWTAKAEGMRHLARETHPPTNLRYLRILARRALAVVPPGHADVRVRLDHLARVATARELPIELAGVRLSPRQWQREAFASDALQKLAAQWPSTHAALYERVLERELVPGSADDARVRALAATNEHTAALALLAEVRKRDVDAFLTCAAQAERLADDAYFVGAGSGYRHAYLRHALDGAEIFASWATSGGEGSARMLDVNRIRAKLAGTSGAAQGRVR